MTCIRSCDYCIISLFAETVLHVGQVPMLVVLYNKQSSANNRTNVCRDAFSCCSLFITMRNGLKLNELANGNNLLGARQEIIMVMHR